MPTPRPRARPGGRSAGSSPMRSKTRPPAYEPSAPALWWKRFAAPKIAPWWSGPEELADQRRGQGRRREERRPEEAGEEIEVPGLPDEREVEEGGRPEPVGEDERRRAPIRVATVPATRMPSTLAAAQRLIAFAATAGVSPRSVAWGGRWVVIRKSVKPHPMSPTVMAQKAGVPMAVRRSTDGGCGPRAGVPDEEAPRARGAPARRPEPARREARRGRRRGDARATAASRRYVWRQPTAAAAWAAT